MTFYLQFISGRAKWLTHRHTASNGRFITEFERIEKWVLSQFLGTVSTFGKPWKPVLITAQSGTNWKSDLQNIR